MGQIRPLYNVRSVISRAAQGFRALAAVALAFSAALFCRGSAVAADYYHIVGSLDNGGESSLSGTSAARGWATSSNSTDIAVRGITAANSSYYFWSTNQTGSFHALRTPNNASYTSPATSEIVLLPKAYAYFFNKSCGTAASDGSVATLTFNNTTLCEESILDLRCNQNGAYTYCTQIGGSFDIKEGAIRVSPLHCHGKKDIDDYLRITRSIAEPLSPGSSTTPRR